MVASLVLRSSLRFFERHPAQLLLSILGILLGVGIVTAVLITNSSAQRAFSLSASAITGAATHHITGAEFGIDQSLYSKLKREHQMPMAPVIEGYLSIGDELFTVLGLDPFADLGLGRKQLSSDPALALELIKQTNALLISERSRQRLAISLDTPYDAQINGNVSTIRFVGTYRSENPAASDGLLIGDIAVAQHILGRGQTIDRIDLILDQQQAAELRSSLPAHVELSEANLRARTMQDMTRGFQINLTAMSLLALLVGAFLIHNTMTFSILQRRELFATLRITGVTSTGIFMSILSEVAIISIIGSVAGALLGYSLSHYLIQLTTQTINDLYFVLHVQSIWFSPQLFAMVVALGVLTSLVAAAAAATEAARISPIQARMRSNVEARTLSILPRLMLAGLCTMLVGAALAWLPSRSLTLGFIAMMLLIAGYGLAIPWLVSALTAGMRSITSRFGIITQLAIGGVQRSISRTGLAIAALTIAVSATFGVDIMIGSFRNTVDQWLGKTLRSDIYVTVPSSVSARADGSLHPEFIEQVRSMQDVHDVGTSRVIKANTDAGKIDMLVLEPHMRSQQGFDFLEGDSDAIWTRFLNNDAVLISEPLSTRHNVVAGQNIDIFTATTGYRPFIVAGVYFDYGSSHGRVTMARQTFNRYWHDRAYSSIGINLIASADTTRTLDQIREQISRIGDKLLIRSNQEIREQSLIVFDRTFQVTRVLRLLTVGVAFVGIFSALLALQLEKAREFAVLRASGATRFQIAAVIMMQTLLMGVLAGILALPIGRIMADILVNVINLRSFGWSMQSLIPNGSLITTLGLAISSALLAGLYPAWKLSRETIADQLRDE